MYEHQTKPLISHAEFIRRLAAHGGVGLAIILASLVFGVLGYHIIAGMSWIDSLLNASMIMGGMGPVDRLPNDSAKIFASIYALYSGLVLLISVGIIFAPVIHRIFHKLHLKTN